MFMGYGSFIPNGPHLEEFGNQLQDNNIANEKRNLIQLIQYVISQIWGGIG